MGMQPPIPAGPMIFVTGASRSGTTLTSQVLGRHSRVKALRELQYFGSEWSPRGEDRTIRTAEVPRAVATLFARQHPDRGTTAGPEEAEAVRSIVQALPEDPSSTQVFAATMAVFAAQAGKQIACDQTPRNIYYARMLLECFPEARFVHLLRDPRGVLASQKRRWRKRSLLANPSRMPRIHQARLWVNYHPYLVARLWNTATSAALALSDHPRFHVVRFEDLVAAPESSIREICAFLGLEFEPEMLEVEHTNSSHVLSTGRPAGFSRDAIDAWQSTLSRDDLAVIAERCSGVMKKAGYPLETTRLRPWSRCLMTMGYAGHLAGAVALNPGRVLIQARALGGATRARSGIRAEAAPPASEADVSVAGPETDDQTSRRVFGLRFMDVTLERAAEHLVECAEADRRTRVGFVNAHCLNVSMRDPELGRALTGADVLFADGAGMLLASRMHGQGLRHNVNGTDLFPRLVDRAEVEGVSLALLGGAPGVVDRCVDALRLTHPGLRIAYSHDGFFDRASDARIVDAINDSGAKILLVAMGVPLQEKWIQDQGDRLQVPVIIGVGALFDFVSGRVPRAPRLIRALKCEWLFRLAIEPRRLFVRYALGNPMFVMRAARYAATRRPRQESTPE
jgi:N-acetylglucosaminyldiphosphoundecaprenol N-acetyl-beta-D-mannosaminyltransferase